MRSAKVNLAGEEDPHFKHRYKVISCLPACLLMYSAHVWLRRIGLHVVTIMGFILKLGLSHYPLFRQAGNVLVRFSLLLFYPVDLDFAVSISTCDRHFSHDLSENSEFTPGAVYLSVSDVTAQFPRELTVAPCIHRNESMLHMYNFTFIIGNSFAECVFLSSNLSRGKNQTSTSSK